MELFLKAIFLNRSRASHRRSLAAIVVTVATFAVIISVFSYSHGQDHFASIPVRGDGSWYATFVIGEKQIQDADIFYHGIGHSIDNARQADIVFLGTSRALFALDWQAFEAFAAKHHVKMFNMAFAGIMDGAFALMLSRKWNIHPRLWVIDLYPGPPGDFSTSFFNTDPARRSSFVQETLAKSEVTAWRDVIVRNLRWRGKMMVGAEAHEAYRSSKTGNWYLDNFPFRLLKDLPKIEEDGSGDCHIEQQEVSAARSFIGELGGAAILTQGPGKFSCIQRAQELADALGTPFFCAQFEGV